MDRKGSVLTRDTHAAFDAIRKALRECGTVEELDAVAKEHRQEFNALPDDLKAIVRHLKEYRAKQIDGEL